MRRSSLGNSRSRENCIETPRWISKRNFFWQANYAVSKGYCFGSKRFHVLRYFLWEVAYRYDWVGRSKTGQRQQKRQEKVARGIGRTDSQWLVLLESNSISRKFFAFSWIRWNSAYYFCSYFVFSVGRIYYLDYIDQQSLY